MPSAPPPTGERLGTEALFRAHAKFVVSLLRRLGAPASDLDDLVQEVFVVAHRKGGYVPGPAQPRSWLSAIAVHVARAGRRARTRREPAASPEIDLARATGADPAECFEARRALERVQQALDTLPLELRAAFILYEIEGEPCESIAAVWGVPIGTIYSRLHTARRRFLAAYHTSSEPLERVHQYAMGDR